MTDLPPPRNGADILAGALARQGCTTAYGIPGGEVLALVEALERAGIRFILTKHENAAGFMAEGRWHAESSRAENPAPGAAPGRAAPGILVATLGPGMANALNVVANAHQERAPLIFLTGCVDAAEAESYTHQVFDHAAVLAPVVKATFRAARGSLGTMITKALALALDGQPGPVHIDVPISVAEDVTDEPLPPAPAPGRPGLPEASELVKATAALDGARRPLVIAGVDALNDAAGAGLSALCRALGAPLITTYKAKGLMDEADSLSLGGAGLSPKADAHLLPLVRAADVIVLAGYDPIEMRIGWRNPWGEDSHVIEISPVARTHGMHRITQDLRGGVSATLEALADALHACDRSPAASAWPQGEPARVRADLAAAFAAEDTGWGPATVFHTLRDCLPADTVATADSGAHRILLSQIWRCATPRTLLQSAALCTMGCAVPLAAGHAHAAPGTPVVAFVGDAGLEMGLGELATLRDLGLPVIVVVLVDESLALIELKQRGAQRPNAGVDFPGSDFPAIARALGGHGAWVDDTEALRREARDALARPSFTVLACRIGRRAYDGKL